MKDSQRSGLTREQWSAMTLYEKFEQVVIFVLSVIIAAIIVASTSYIAHREAQLGGKKT